MTIEDSHKLTHHPLSLAEYAHRKPIRQTFEEIFHYRYVCRYAALSAKIPLVNEPAINVSRFVLCERLWVYSVRSAVEAGYFDVKHDTYHDTLGKLKAFEVRNEGDLNGSGCWIHKIPIYWQSRHFILKVTPKVTPTN